VTFDEGLGGAGLAAAPAKARGASAAGRSIVASFPVSTTAPHAAAGAIGDGSRGWMSPHSDTRLEALGATPCRCRHRNGYGVLP
jgi:hypothetical protein